MTAPMAEIVRSIRDRIEEIDRQMRDLPRERTTLAAMLENVEAGQITEPGNRVGPTQGVLWLLKEQPGLTATQIIDDLQDKVVTKAKNVRRNLDQTIRNLQEREMITQNGQGGFVLAKQ